MARLTRHELKQDELRTAFEEYERFMKLHWREIVTVIGILMVAVGSAAGLKLYAGRQDAGANAELGAALRTFQAYVGSAAPGTLGPDAESYSTPQEKYKKALEKFETVIRKYPRQKAAAVARYHAGVCQAQLGEDALALKTFQEASRNSDREFASLAQLALAGELAKTGKLADAVKIYQTLSDHPTSSVPRATAQMALADAYRDTQPAQARRIYEQLEKEFASDSVLAQAIHQELDSLPR